MLFTLAVVTAGAACHHHSSGGLHGRGPQMHQVLFHSWTPAMSTAAASTSASTCAVRGTALLLGSSYPGQLQASMQDAAHMRVMQGAWDAGLRRRMWPTRCWTAWTP